MNSSFDRNTKGKGKEEWLTPPKIVKALGVFDLDPCSPVKRPWDTAKKHYTIVDDGLKQPWTGRVWCNPPYGNKTEKWLEKMAEHNNGIALIFARTETRMFFDYIWGKITGIFFFKGRLTFYNVDGTPASGCAGAPSCLIAYGEENAIALKNCKLNGIFIKLKKGGIIYEKIAGHILPPASLF